MPTDFPTILVTGGAGFIGSHTCKALAAAGYRPVVFDSLERGRADFVRWGPLVVGDLREPAAIAAAFADRRPAAVIHFAGYIDVGESVAHPERYFENNVGGTENLLAAMDDAGCRALVFSSTCAVYGVPSRVPIPEDEPAKPINPYGESKLRVERLLAGRGGSPADREDSADLGGSASDAAGRKTSAPQEASHGAAAMLRYATLRYFNAAGADPDGELFEAHEPETHLVPLVLRASAGLRPSISIYGDDYPTPDGTCIRDYVHVVDLAAAHRLALERLLAGGPSFTVNLGTGRGHSVREIVDAARRVTGREIPVEVAPRREGDPPRLVADPTRARDLLGWIPARSGLPTILADVWRTLPGRE